MKIKTALLAAAALTVLVSCSNDSVLIESNCIKSGLQGAVCFGTADIDGDTVITPGTESTDPHLGPTDTRNTAENEGKDAIPTRHIQEPSLNTRRFRFLRAATSLSSRQPYRTGRKLQMS